MKMNEQNNPNISQGETHSDLFDVVLIYLKKYADITSHSFTLKHPSKGLFD